MVRYLTFMQEQLTHRLYPSSSGSIELIMRWVEVGVSQCLVRVLIYSLIKHDYGGLAPLVVSVAMTIPYYNNLFFFLNQGTYLSGLLDYINV